MATLRDAWRRRDGKGQLEVVANDINPQDLARLLVMIIGLRAACMADLDDQIQHRDVLLFFVWATHCAGMLPGRAVGQRLLRLMRSLAAVLDDDDDDDNDLQYLDSVNDGLDAILWRAMTAVLDDDRGLDGPMRRALAAAYREWLARDDKTVDYVKTILFDDGLEMYKALGHHIPPGAYEPGAHLDSETYATAMQRSMFWKNSQGNLDADDVVELDEHRTTLAYEVGLAPETLTTAEVRAYAAMYHARTATLSVSDLAGKDRDDGHYASLGIGAFGAVETRLFSIARTVTCHPMTNPSLWDHPDLGLRAHTISGDTSDLVPNRTFFQTKVRDALGPQNHNYPGPATEATLLTGKNMSSLGEMKEGLCTYDVVVRDLDAWAGLSGARQS